MMIMCDHVDYSGMLKTIQSNVSILLIHLRRSIFISIHLVWLTYSFFKSFHYNNMVIADDDEKNNVSIPLV